MEVDAPRQEIRLPALAPPLSHYCDAVVTGGFVFVSGCLALDGSGQLVGDGDVRHQASQVFENLDAVLVAAGSSSAEVARVTVYLLHIDDRSTINPVRQAYFGETRPASTLVQVGALAIPGALLEVEAIATVSEKAAQVPTAPTQTRPGGATAWQ